MWKGSVYVITNTNCATKIGLCADRATKTGHRRDKIFAADSEDNIIYDIDVNTMQIEGQIQLPDNDSPDAIGYDPVDHRIFVSDPGSPVDPLKR